MSLPMIFIVSLCGALGAVARFVVDTFIKHIKTTIFPSSTLIINTLAAVIFAFMALHAHYGNPYVWVTTGFLGGFSTFSTAMNEIVMLARKKYWVDCIVYAIFAILIPLVAFYLIILFG